MTQEIICEWVAELQKIEVIRNNLTSLCKRNTFPENVFAMSQLQELQKIAAVGWCFVQPGFGWRNIEGKGDLTQTVH